MRKVIGMIALLVGAASVALAVPVAPEIDARSGVSALALLSGGLLLIRGRRKK